MSPGSHTPVSFRLLFSARDTGAALNIASLVSAAYDDRRFVTRKKPRKPAVSVATLERAGVRPAAPLATDRKATLLALEGMNGAEYWLTLDNFYVITRYNHSPLYAMAVYQLSREIARRSAAELAAHGR